MCKNQFCSDNESFSAERGVMRALHFQKGEAAQAKLIRVVQGKRVLDVAVDIRPESPTYGKYVSVELSAENKRMFFIRADLHMDIWCWRTTPYFSINVIITMHRKWRGTYRWNDPALAIDWGIDPKSDSLSLEMLRHRLSNLPESFSEN